MNKTKLVQEETNKTKLIQKDAGGTGNNTTALLIDVAILGFLLSIYFGFFTRHEEAIKKGIIKNYKEEKKEIDSLFAIKNQGIPLVQDIVKKIPSQGIRAILALTEFSPFQELIILTKKATNKHNRRIFLMKILVRFFLVAFLLLISHIFLTLFNLLPGPLPYIHKVVLTFSFLVIMMTFIVSRYPRA